VWAAVVISKRARLAAEVQAWHIRGARATVVSRLSRLHFRVQTGRSDQDRHISSRRRVSSIGCAGWGCRCGWSR
jgi:hypothetical protein